MTRIENPFSFTFQSCDHSQPTSSLVSRPTFQSSQKTEIKGMEKIRQGKINRIKKKGRVVVNKIPFIPALLFSRKKKKKIDHKKWGPRRNTSNMIPESRCPKLASGIYHRGMKITRELSCSLRLNRITLSDPKI